MSKYITSIETIDTGGHVEVDLIHLKTGQVMTVTDDAVCVWASLEDYEKSFDGYSAECAVVNLPFSDEEMTAYVTRT